ncbi:MAG TPA: hypothetical protein IGR89_02355 [Oscillatoriaceae cyanobacterium M7585_C2015_266]|nr:hypothetical protein [Oscillatoriaceae cyanobacterium M7585_C2015_266]
MLLLRYESKLAEITIKAEPVPTKASTPKPPSPSPELGPRHKWTYEQWVAQLRREADAAAEKKPEKLTVLAGDSISLWFPTNMLPPGRYWLNQGISGETTEGLLKRLPLFDRTQPDAIFVMIGINDLIRGIADETIINNLRAIIQDLQTVHSNAHIVIQSILPHSGAKSTWEGRKRLLQIPNQRIRSLNEQIAALAIEEGVKFLDLYPLFADSQGNLRLDLTTDGLHLSERGYLVWRSALQLFDNLELSQPPV